MSEEKKADEIKTAVPTSAEQAPATVAEPKVEAQAKTSESATAQPQQAQPEVAKASEKTLSNLAYIKMRQEKKALKAELEALRAAKAAPQTPQAQPGVVTPAQVAPETNQGQAIAYDPIRLKAEIIAELQQAQNREQAEAQKQAAEEAALKALAEDSDISSVPDGIAEVLDLIDNDPKLAKINAIDPTLAIQQAKIVFCSKKGITPSAPAPVMHPRGSGSMPTQMTDFDAIAKKLKTTQPGTKEFNLLVAQLNEAARK